LRVEQNPSQSVERQYRKEPEYVYAELAALKLINHMNANYCKKHRFYVTEEGEKLTIRVELACPKEI